MAPAYFMTRSVSGRSRNGVGRDRQLTIIMCASIGEGKLGTSCLDIFFVADNLEIRDQIVRFLITIFLVAGEHLVHDRVETLGNVRLQADGPLDDAVANPANGVGLRFADKREAAGEQRVDNDAKAVD